VNELSHNGDHKNNGIAKPECRNDSDSAENIVGKTERSHQSMEHFDDMNIFFELY
jgi:hypothetical protein